MACGGGLIGILVLLLPAAVQAASCDSERSRTGLTVAVREGDVAVAAVDAASPAARAGFRPGDVVLQVNDVVPRNCAQWGRAVEDAREDAKAVLVLVLRDGAEVPLALGAGTWVVPPEPADVGTPPASPGVAAAPPVVRPGATTTTAPVRPATPPPPLPPDVPVSVEGVLAGLERLAPPNDPPSDLTVYREAVARVRREIETLAARGAAPAAEVTALRRAVRHYEAAEIAWDAIEGERVEERRSRRLPVAENATVPYFGDSPAATVIDEFAFLDATVAREPTGGPLGIESSGLWRPVWARILLWERGAREVAALRGAAPADAP